MDTLKLVRIDFIIAAITTALLFAFVFKQASLDVNWLIIGGLLYLIALFISVFIHCLIHSITDD